MSVQEILSAFDTLLEIEPTLTDEQLNRVYRNIVMRCDGLSFTQHKFDEILARRSTRS